MSTVDPEQDASSRTVLKERRNGADDPIASALECRDSAAGGPAISQWPVGERPREKLIERGAQALSDAELLAVLPRSVPGEHTAVDLAPNDSATYVVCSMLLSTPCARLAAWAMPAAPRSALA